MISSGLLEELRRLYDTHGISGRKDAIDCRRDGIYQAIGLKEFQAYFESSCPSQALLDASIFDVKLATRRYARYQLRWIRKRLCKQNVYELDSSDVQYWVENVNRPALQHANDFLDGKHKKTGEQYVSSEPWRKHNCLPCNRILNGVHEYDVHLKSKQHKSYLKRRRRIANQNSSNNSEMKINFSSSASLLMLVGWSLVCAILVNFHTCVICNHSLPRQMHDQYLLRYTSHPWYAHQPCYLFMFPYRYSVYYECW